MKNDYHLPKYSNKQIVNLFKSNEPFEDLETIRKTEQLLKEKRGYVFRMPPPKSNVILLLSGGLDTVTMWDMLMRIYQLNVYPVFIRRGQIRMPIEENSVDFFSGYYRKIHDQYFHPPKKITTFIPPLEIRWDITKFGTYPINELLECRGIPMYSSLLSNFAVQYAYYLEIKYAIKTRTIFCGYVPGDGRYLRYENLTALRTNTHNIISLTGETDWQFTSLAIEKELKIILTKYDLVKYADYYHIPIEHTFSCIKYSYYHCGKCVYCQNKKFVFKKTGIMDKTIYLDRVNFPILTIILNKIKLMIITFFFSLKIFLELIRSFIYFLQFRY